MSEETAKLKAILAEINRICRVPTPSGTKAYTHFMRDFDQIRTLTAPYVKEEQNE